MESYDEIILLVNIFFHIISIKVIDVTVPQFKSDRINWCSFQNSNQNIQLFLSFLSFQNVIHYRKQSKHKFKNLDRRRNHYCYTRIYY